MAVGSRAFRVDGGDYEFAFLLGVVMMNHFVASRAKFHPEGGMYCIRSAFEEGEEVLVSLSATADDVFLLYVDTSTEATSSRMFISSQRTSATEWALRATMA